MSNLILFQIKVFAKNIKETSLARYFVKVTARPSFTQLRVIRRINGVYYIRKKKICYKDSVVSTSYLNLVVASKFGLSFNKSYFSLIALTNTMGTFKFSRQ